MLKYFPRILHRHLNTFCVFSEYAEIMKNTQKEIFTSTKSLGTLKGQCFEKIEGGVICLRRVNSLQYLFFGYLLKKVLHSTLLHLPPLRFHCAGGCWDLTQDSMPFVWLIFFECGSFFQSCFLIFVLSILGFDLVALSACLEVH
jgi:hypothetical protein